ncbi:hypothetical protein ALQ04_03888 [Pseudomonas cichorii]|uniref:Uncharacterized protein n=1 Tax=Pseudomonas cichorii TaxID=36746 RepID=A0A3M4M124_PSECI|nr:hypothetical protein [Pseudomonas cichorii]RMQ47427.1 hypothetical protein ALQ04_03888 [Pseudomonas cichorii]
MAAGMNSFAKKLSRINPLPPRKKSMERTFQKHGDPAIGQLLSAWLVAVERYVKLLKYDNCWWHNERANVSTLAGAAWSIPGWVALEEYPTQKYRPHTSCMDEVLGGRGRCDLYISNPDEDFAFEAKHAWQLIGGPDAVTAALNAAKTDAITLKGEAGRHFAATFIVPFLTKKQIQGLTIDEVHEQLNQWLHSQNDFSRDTSSNTAYAWIFPGTDLESFCNDTCHYPGVVLVLEEVPAS